MSILKRLIAENDYTQNQIAQLYNGHRLGLDIRKYADPSFSSEQMDQLRKALMFKVDIDDLIDPSIRVEDMYDTWIERAIEKHLSDITLDFLTYVEMIRLITNDGFRKDLFDDLGIPSIAGMLIYMLYKTDYIDDIVECDFTWEQRELMTSGNISLAFPGMSDMYFNIKSNAELAA